MLRGSQKFDGLKTPEVACFEKFFVRPIGNRYIEISFEPPIFDPGFWNFPTLEI